MIFLRRNACRYVCTTCLYLLSVFDEIGIALLPGKQLSFLFVYKDVR